MYVIEQFLKQRLLFYIRSSLCARDHMIVGFTSTYTISSHHHFGIIILSLKRSYTYANIGEYCMLTFGYILNNILYFYIYNKSKCVRPHYMQYKNKGGRDSLNIQKE